MTNNYDEIIKNQTKYLKKDLRNICVESSFNNDWIPYITNIMIKIRFNNPTIEKEVIGYFNRLETPNHVEHNNQIHIQFNFKIMNKKFNIPLLDNTMIYKNKIYTALNINWYINYFKFIKNI